VAEVDDKIVTSFCDVVTSRDEVNIKRPRRFGTKVMGEAMAPASESNSSGGAESGVGAKPSLRPGIGRHVLVHVLVLVFGACRDDGHATGPLAAPAVAQPG